jgi:ABC-type sulfate/molybdate transport systems, ATPase component
VKPQHRKIGFVFQDYALFPHMNVRENISFALKKNESAEIVEELMHVTGLTGLAARNIQTLSGGQKQRVALARAIASKPSILLLDEPLSAIDQNMRVQLQHTLEEVHKRYKLTSILVSHNMEEIIRLSDFVIHLEEGQVRQISAPVSFFRDHNSAPEITGQVVSIEKNPDGSCTFILLNNRIIKIYSDNDGQQVEVGEKVGIVYKNDVAKIRKL